MKVKPIPEGQRSVTTGLTVLDTAQAIEYYKAAFDAKEISRMAGPNGRIVHAEIKIGDSIIFLNDEFPEMPTATRSPQTLKGTTSSIYLYVSDVDSAFAKAEKAGGKVNMPLSNMFWGDRFGQIIDPFGHIWSLATRVENVTPEESKKRAQTFWSASSR